MKYLIGNWKSNYNSTETLDWIEKVKAASPKASTNLTTVICPNYVHMPLFKQNLPEQILGAQMISPYPSGAYTGATSAEILKEYVRYVIVAHSERRMYFNEVNQEIVNQVYQAIEANITPIIAVDKQTWYSLLSSIHTTHIEKSIIMYEPPEAISIPDGGIGSGQAAPIEDVINKIKEIKSYFSPKAIIYGGSVKSHNIANFISQEEIDGVLPGSASLNPEEWIKMIQNANLALEQS
jgi:triosephosphate isomerase